MHRLLMLIAATFVASTVAGCGASAIAGSLVALGSDKGSSSSSAAAAPAVAAVSPVNGSHAGGTTITITGHSFPADATVSVGGVAATDVQVMDAGTMTATTPASSVVSGEVDVVVASASTGSGALAGGFVYTTSALNVFVQR